MTNKVIKIIIFLVVLSAFSLLLNSPRPVLAIDASLKLAHDDGAQCFINNQEVWNNITSAHSHRYWNRIINVSKYLQIGQNFLACWVSNGDGNRGNRGGFFDAELIVNSSTIIPKSSSGWKYFGTGGSTTRPPIDNNQRSWQESTYNDTNWQNGTAPFGGHANQNKHILNRAPDSAWFRKSFYLDPSLFNQLPSPPSPTNCSLYANRTTCLSQHGCIWTGTGCFDINQVHCSSFTNQIDCINKSGCLWTGNSCVVSSTPLSCSHFNTRVSCLSNSGCLWTGYSCLNSILATCGSFNNQTDCLTKPGCNWTSSGCIDGQALYDQTLFRIRAQSLTGCWRPAIHRLDNYQKLPANIEGLVLESNRPLITGLVKYGNQIEVFVNNKSIGQAVVKEGEYSGVANFYFKPDKGLVLSNNISEIHQIKIVATNPHDKSVCTTGPFNFIVVPYPAPVIHRLGEIPYVQRATPLIIRDRQPIVTGLVRYGSVVEIYLNNKLVGRATVKEGERTGVSNFFLRLPTLKTGNYTLYSIAKKAGQEDTESRPSQVFTFTVQ